jgi:ribonuclease D
MMTAIRQWFRRLFPASADSQPKRPDSWPTREEIARLPPFAALDFGRIVEVNTPAAARRAYQELAAAAVVGFDTESRPTFQKGEVSRGPHVVQFATLDRAYVFMLHDPECRRTAAALIALAALKKVGFGLNDDLIRIRAKLRVEPQNVHDLETLFAEKGFGRGVGVKVGVALVLKRRFLKSKKASTSNWGRPRLSDAQLLYAANDSYAAIRVYHALTAA